MVFFNASPEGLPSTIQIEGKIRLDLAEDHAGFLQKIVYETVSNAEIGMRNAEGGSRNVEGGSRNVEGGSRNAEEGSRNAEL